MSMTHLSHENEHPSHHIPHYLHDDGEEYELMVLQLEREMKPRQ